MCLRAQIPSWFRWGSCTCQLHPGRHLEQTSKQYTRRFELFNVAYLLSWCIFRSIAKQYISVVCAVVVVSSSSLPSPSLTTSPWVNAHILRKQSCGHLTSGNATMTNSAIRNKNTAKNSWPSALIALRNWHRWRRHQPVARTPPPSLRQWLYLAALLCQTNKCEAYWAAGRKTQTYWHISIRLFKSWTHELKLAKN